MPTKFKQTPPSDIHCDNDLCQKDLDVDRF